MKLWKALHNESSPLAFLLLTKKLFVGRLVSLKLKNGWTHKDVTSANQLHGKNDCCSCNPIKSWCIVATRYIKLVAEDEYHSIPKYLRLNDQVDEIKCFVSKQSFTLHRSCTSISLNTTKIFQLFYSQQSDKGVGVHISAQSHKWGQTSGCICINKWLPLCSQRLPSTFYPDI